MRFAALTTSYGTEQGTSSTETEDVLFFSPSGARVEEKLFRTSAESVRNNGETSRVRTLPYKRLQDYFMIVNDFVISEGYAIKRKFCNQL
jgi:hypothetical protein